MAKRTPEDLGGAHRPPRPHLLSVTRPLAAELVAWLCAEPSVRAVSEAGAVRRWVEEAHEIEVVAASADPRAVIERLAAFPKARRVLSRSEGGAAVLVEPGLPVRLAVVTEAAFPSVLHRLTGSPAHYQKLRELPRSPGVDLPPDDGDGDRRPAKDEAALYARLGLPFIPPELREDQGEIEAALAGTLPDLVRSEDVVGLVHQHTLHSDGRASVRQMAEAAQALGYRWMTVTEHSTAADYAHGVGPDRLRAVFDDIDAVNAALTGFRVLKGAEVDILADGRLDYEDHILDRLEVVIASVHQRFDQDEATMTRRLVRAVSHPRVHLLAHPTGRLLHQRAPVEARWEEVFAAAAAHGTAMEVNGNPDRLDLKPAHLRRALAAGCRIAVSTDAHHPDALGNVAYAVATARRGWVRRADVINCANADAFLRGLRDAKEKCGSPL